MLRFFLFLISLALCAVSGYELNRRYQESHFLVLQTAPLNRADTLMVQQRWQEAKMLAKEVQAQPQLGDRKRAQSIEMAADAALNSAPLQARAFIYGALSGEAQNGASLAGALMLDLLLIGDIRDLVVQGYKEIVYEQGDEVVIALSAAGLGLALLPEIHWAPALLKGLKRAGALSERFIRILRKHAHTALQSGDFKPLTGIVENFARATRTLGPGPVSGAMRAVQNETDLARLASSATRNPQQSYAIATLAGSRGLRKVSTSGRNVSSVARRLKVSSRLAKSARKSVGILPLHIVIALFISALLGLIWSLPGKRWLSTRGRA